MKNLLLQTTKYIVNLGISALVGISIYVRYALWVAAPISSSREESIEILKSKITNQGVKHGLTIFLVTALLAGFTWLIQTQVEKQNNLRELLIITILNLLLLGIALGLGISDAYNGLTSEIDRHF